MRIREDEPITNVQEPILSEKRSCLKGGCFSSCGCLAMFLVLFILFLRISWGPKTAQLSKIPDNIKSDMPIFASEKVLRVKQIRASDVNRTLATLEAVPRIIIVPCFEIYAVHKKTDKRALDYISASFSSVHSIFKSPGKKNSVDTYILKWGALSENIETIRDFYKSKLEEYGFIIDEKYNNANNYEVEFYKSDISGKIHIENYDLREKGVEGITLEIKLPHKK